MTDDESRPCAAGRDCADAPAFRGRPAPTRGGPLCAACCRRAALDVRALADDYARLGAEMAPAAHGLTAHVTATDDTTAPIVLAVEALRRDIFWALTVWEPPVREAVGLPPETTRGVREPWAVRVAATVLAHHARALASLGPTWGYADGLDAGPVARDGVHAVETLRQLHRRARLACGLTRRTFHLPGDCSHCGAQSLLRADGASTIRCGVCDRVWSYDEYQRYVGLTLAQLGTI